MYCNIFFAFMCILSIEIRKIHEAIEILVFFWDPIMNQENHVSRIESSLFSFDMKFFCNRLLIKRYDQIKFCILIIDYGLNQRRKNGNNQRKQWII